MIWHCCRFLLLSPPPCSLSHSPSLTSSIPLSSLSSLSTLTVSAGHLPQVPSRSDSHSGSLPHWHEEGASVGSHRHDGAVRPLGAGGQKAQNRQEENPRYGSVRTRRNHKNMHWTSTHSRKYAYCRQLTFFFRQEHYMQSLSFVCSHTLSLIVSQSSQSKKTKNNWNWHLTGCLLH